MRKIPEMVSLSIGRHNLGLLNVEEEVVVTMI